MALAKAEIAREKSNPEQAEEETRSQPQEEEAPHTAGTAGGTPVGVHWRQSESALLMDAFNILLEEDVFRTNPRLWKNSTAAKPGCIPPAGSHVCHGKPSSGKR